MRTKFKSIGILLVMSLAMAPLGLSSALAQSAPPAPAAAEMTEAEVRKVDLSASKVTLKHGAIKNLDMPGMTMVFGVKDKAILETVQPGDKIRFTADKDGSNLIVTRVEKVQ